MEKCHILFPGKFKPFHDGHMSLIKKYLNSEKYDTDITILISRVEKDGLTAKTTKWFLDKIFDGNKRVKVKIARDNSPIKTTYDMTGEAEYGDGIYAMCTSSKGGDYQRAIDYRDLFAKDGKYHTKGVEVIVFPVDPKPAKYKNRPGINGDISSTIIRKDIKHREYDLFKDAYRVMLEDKDIDEGTLKMYYKKMCSEIPTDAKIEESLQYPLFEGGAAGHMEHPYEIKEWNFKTIKSLITDLFAGRIEDITEKLDGQNLFASVDDDGNTIFARNDKQLFYTPWKLEDIINNPRWTGIPSVQHAFTNAAETIDKIFKNITKASSVFNYDDRLDGARYRYWVNLEILDTLNYNVIPYVESKISIHGLKTTCFAYGNSITDDTNSSHSVYDTNSGIERDILDIIQKAINKTNKTAFKAQITPQVIFHKIDNGEKKAMKYISKIDEILNRYGLGDIASVQEYKEVALTERILKSRIKFVEGVICHALVDRWVYGNKTKFADICKLRKLDGAPLTKDEIIEIKRFDKEDIKKVMKDIVAPIDTIFIALGNEILKSVSGLANAGHEKEVVSKLRSEMRDIKASVEKTDDPKSKEKLENALRRLSTVNDELNATEGIVFRYGGHTLKLTGSFAPLNQLFGLKAGKFKR